jgi:creatinine amidohydrolase
VQYERLRPAQIASIRKECPVAYLPIGTLEWHGEHNPVGLDTLKEHALLIHCARAAGGLVFPPLYYGEQRERQLMELNFRDEISAKMGLPPENFAPGYMYQSASEQNTNYHHHLIHIFHEIKSLGFRFLIVGAGHYPLLGHSRAAASIFHATQGKEKPRMNVFCMSGYDLVKGQFEPCGDHAGKYETSLLMYLDPGMQDLSLLPSDRNVRPLGVSHNQPQDSSAEFGKTAVEAIVRAIKERVDEFLEMFRAEP